MKLIYLANSYSFSHENKDFANFVKLKRRHLESYVGGRLKKKYGVALILPIAMSASMADLCEFDDGFSTWKNEDLLYISKCDEVWVLQSDGWRESIGVTAEIQFAKHKGIPVKYVQADTLEVTDEPL